MRMAECVTSACLPPTYVTRFSPAELAPSPEQVSRYAGGSRYRLEKKHHELVTQVLEQARCICRPVIAYALHPLLARPLAEGEVALASGIKLELPVTLVGFRAQFLAAVVVTLGEELEQTCRRLWNKGDPLRSIFLNAAGLAMLELLTKAAFGIISGLARERGLYTGRRMTPGCCDELNMSLQQTLFHLVDAAAAGVVLNAGLVMTPLKSQSFLVGLTPDPAQATPVPKCLSCSRRDCLYRHTELI